VAGCPVAVAPRELTIMDKEEKVEVDEHELRKRLLEIIDQADRMEHIIQHVRMFARQAGRAETSPVHVNDVVRSGIELLSGQFRAHGLDVEVDLAAGLPPVLANPYSLEEIIVNLLNNARDALEEKRETGAAASHRVLVRTGMNGATDPGKVRIDVVDSGVGIPPEILAKVFDPFFTTKDPDKGTGLGLAISQSIAAEFGGWLEIDSKAGTGTTVTVSLPAAVEGTA
jgi:signal transduction histidine kinase